MVKKIINYVTNKTPWGKTAPLLNTQSFQFYLNVSTEFSEISDKIYREYREISDFIMNSNQH